MSVKKELTVFNASSQSMSIATIVSHNSDWGNDKPSNNFNNVSVGAFSRLKNEEDIDSDASSAVFQMTITFANGDQITVTADLKKNYEPQRFIPGGQSGNNYRGYAYTDSDTMLLVLMPNVTSQTWMGDTWDTIKNKTLSQVALPGSHDAGIYTLSYPTTFSTEDNTRTQKVKIGDQLTQGSRFFELRPTFWSHETDNHQVYLGHFKDTGVLGIQGSLGENTSNVFADIAAFMDDPDNQYEIIVLRFEQYGNVNNDLADFTNDQKAEFKQQVLNQLGDYLYTSSDSSCNLGNVKLQDIYNSGRRVIAVFDDFAGSDSKGNVLLDPSVGIFSYGAQNSQANYRMLDSFANSDDFSTMMGNQFSKFGDFSSSNGSMFLLSWTLTMQLESSDFLDNSIFNLATKANSYLWYGMYEMFMANIASTSKIPNIIYVDYVDSDYCLAEAAYCLNSFATGY